MQVSSREVETASAATPWSKPWLQLYELTVTARTCPQCCAPPLCAEAEDGGSYKQCGCIARCWQNRSKSDRNVLGLGRVGWKRWERGSWKKTAMKRKQSGPGIEEKWIDMYHTQARGLQTPNLACCQATGFASTFTADRGTCQRCHRTIRAAWSAQMSFTFPKPGQ